MGRLYGVGVILLVLVGAVPATLSGQVTGEDEPPHAASPGFELHQNYPNPFSPSTRIPFTLHPELFEADRPVLVSARIYNVLQQLVAIPTALNHPEGNGVPVDNLEYTTPGQNEAYWDGLDQNGRPVASGIYYLQFIVNGERAVRKMIVAR